MAKALLAVFAATGNQGNSTANLVLDDPELSQRYAVRAISRDISNPKMADLKTKGAELVQADLDDPSSLPAALKGVEYLFFMTTTQYQGNTREIETRQAKSVCEEAIKQGVKYIIFSSMSHPFKISNGKLKNVDSFDDKAEIEEYIRTLPVKSAFFAPGSFMQNFQSLHLRPQPSYNGDGTFAISNILPGDALVPFIDITDTGKWIGAILSDPEKYEGKFFAAAGGLYSLDEACKLLQEVSGKTVRYQQVPDEVFKSFLPEGLKDSLYEMWVLNRDYGYFGENMKELVQWSKDQARGKVTGLGEFLKKHDYKLE